MGAPGICSENSSSGQRSSSGRAITRLRRYGGARDEGAGRLYTRHLIRGGLSRRLQRPPRTARPALRVTVLQWTGHSGLDWHRADQDARQGRKPHSQEKPEHRGVRLLLDAAAQDAVLARLELPRSLRRRRPPCGQTSSARHRDAARSEVRRSAIPALPARRRYHAHGDGFRGVACLGLEQQIPAPKSIMASRSLAEPSPHSKKCRKPSRPTPLAPPRNCGARRWQQRP
jgi:hypothetical protein